MIAELNAVDIDGNVVVNGPESLDQWVQNHHFFSNTERGNKGIKVLKKQVAAFTERVDAQKLQTRGSEGSDHNESIDGGTPSLRLALPAFEDCTKVNEGKNVPVAHPVSPFGQPNSNDDGSEWVNVLSPES